MQMQDVEGHASVVPHATKPQTQRAEGWGHRASMLTTC